MQCFRCSCCPTPWCATRSAREDDERAMIRSLINMLVWNLVVVFFVVLW